MIVTAAPLPEAFAVELTVEGGNGAPTITAAPVGRDPYPVRIIGDGTEPNLTILDYEAPFGIEIEYRVVRGSATASATVTLEASGCVLSSSAVPGSAMPVTVVEALPHEWEARSAWFDVVDRRDPVVSAAPMRYRSGSWVIYARGSDERRALLALLTPGAPVMLRTSVAEVIDDALALPETVSEDPHVDATGGRLFTIRYQAVTRPLGPFPGASDWTYARLAAAHAAYAEVPESFTTYRALYAGPPAVPVALPDLDPLKVGS